MTSLFPSIIPGEWKDDSYSRKELERMDWNEIRSIAAQHESDEINGKSDREDMEDFLEGEKRV